MISNTNIRIVVTAALMVPVYIACTKLYNKYIRRVAHTITILQHSSGNFANSDIRVLNYVLENKRAIERLNIDINVTILPSIKYDSCNFYANVLYPRLRIDDKQTHCGDTEILDVYRNILGADAKNQYADIPPKVQPMFEHDEESPFEQNYEKLVLRNFNISAAQIFDVLHQLNTGAAPPAAPGPTGHLTKPQHECDDLAEYGTIEYPGEYTTTQPCPMRSTAPSQK